MLPIYMSGVHLRFRTWRKWWINGLTTPSKCVCSKSSAVDDHPDTLIRREAVTWKHIKPRRRPLPAADAVWIVLRGLSVDWWRGAEETELCAQMGGRTKTLRVCVFVGAASLCTCIGHGLYLDLEGHPCMCLICVCLCGRAQLDSECWHWPGYSVNTQLCWQFRVPSHGQEWILIIQKGSRSRPPLRPLPVGPGWADSAAARKAAKLMWC